MGKNVMLACAITVGFSLAVIAGVALFIQGLSTPAVAADPAPPNTKYLGTIEGVNVYVFRFEGTDCFMTGAGSSNNRHALTCK